MNLRLKLVLLVLAFFLPASSFGVLRPPYTIQVSVPFLKLGRMSDISHSALISLLSVFSCNSFFPFSQMPTPSSPRKEALTGYRGSVLHFLGDPSSKEPEKNYEYFEDGLLLVGIDGLVVTCKDATEAIAEYSEKGFELVDCSGQVRISIIVLYIG